jgi:RNase P/RNase MRP subunit p29|tara:strand:+ start:319 stop:510 length:192 start_codon:yes stop_codon:yes gene_type:complete
MSKMTEKNSYHKKIIGKKVQARFGDNQEIVGVVNKVIDEETFLVQDMETQDLIKVSIFDIRSC